MKDPDMELCVNNILQKKEVIIMGLFAEQQVLHRKRLTI